MQLRFCLGLVLLAAIPAWSQVEPSATGPPQGTEEDTQMMIPPPVSGESYPNVTGAETRSNYLKGALVFSTAYDDNVYAGVIAKPVSDTTFTILPTLTYDRTTPRQKQSFTYSPGFTFYQPTSELDAIDQEALLGYEYRFTPYTALDIGDTFVQTTNVFGQPNGFSSGGITGGTTPTQGVIIPFAEELTDTVRATVSRQFSRRQMVGGGGTFGILDYPNPSQAPGLYNSRNSGGSAFYSQRVSSRNYVGVSYEYTRILAFPPQAQSEAQTHSILPFFTVFFNKTMSVSVSAGPQHYSVDQTGIPSAGAWTPAATASIGWQRSRSNLIASYSRSVTAGGGLLGAYNASNADGSARWLFARNWVAGAGFDYAILKNVTPVITSTNVGGHRVVGNVLVNRTLGEHFGFEIGYDRLHQSYGGIAILATNPDTNREYVSVSYQFRKPLGR
jgi:hypothetical protein